jgi:signal transduction histidine kinase
MKETRVADMISKIAHELRSPLTSIKGFSSMLVTRWDRFTDEQRLQFVETISADAERMGRIVSEVLDLARMEAGRLELHPVRASLAEIVARANERMIELPGADRVAVSVPDGLVAWADPDRLEHVVANLIENAIKFSDDGAITVVGESRDPAWVRLLISDRGVGIEAERVPNVFGGPDPAGKSRSAPTGSGLGLYLSRGIIEAHGGSIEVTSELGEGSVFTLTLPTGSPTTHTTGDPGDKTRHD